MKAIKDRVIFTQIADAKTSAGGIIMQTSDEATYGRVIAIGPKVDSIKVGDRIVLEWNHVNKIKHQDQEYFVIPETWIIGVMEDL